VGESTKYQVEYSVPYEVGVLKAVGYRDGTVVSEWVLKTAGAPAAIRLSVDRSRIAAGGTDISYVAATLVDAGGTPIYATPSDRQLSFRVAGAGTLAGAGNGNPIGTESLQSGVRTSFHGRAVAAVRSGAKPGRITVTVTAPGLKAAKIEVEGR
jgi:beta-galactosidase